MACTCRNFKTSRLYEYVLMCAKCIVYECVDFLCYSGTLRTRGKCYRGEVL